VGVEAARLSATVQEVGVEVGGLGACLLQRLQGIILDLAEVIWLEAMKYFSESD